MIKTFFYVILLQLTALPAHAEFQYLKVGSLNSRVIISKSANQNAPTIYFIPGSGANGPMEDGFYEVLSRELSPLIYIE